jgi:hypothetical protein
MENVSVSREQRQRAEVPPDVANRHRGATAKREGMLLQGQLRHLIELSEQAADVAGCTRPRLRQRARIERDLDHAGSVSEHALVPAQDGLATRLPRELAGMGQAGCTPLAAVL